MKTAFVAAGMKVPKNQRIIEEATKLGKILADNNFVYIQGGSADGIMGATLKEFIKYSTNAEFLIPKAYFDYDAPRIKEIVGEKNFTYTLLVSEADRLKKIRQFDTVIVLPGGTGTLEEMLYVNETIRASEHDARLIIVNVDGYYDGFLSQIKTNVEQGLTDEKSLKFELVKSVDEIKF